jgi:hypothetical protein
MNFSAAARDRLRVRGRYRFACNPTAYYRNVPRKGDNRELEMKGLVFGIGVLALGLAAVTPASADYAVVKFKDTGYCRAWYDHTAKPWGTSQVLWVSVNSWDVAQTKGTYAMGHKWCKGWDK